MPKFINFIIFCVTFCYQISTAEVEKLDPILFLTKKETELANNISVCKNNSNNVDCVKTILCNMAELDQTILNLIYDDRNSGYKTQLEKVFEKTIYHNTLVLKQFMDKFVWFPISQFGAQAEFSAWLIAQHSNNLDLQHKVLFITSHLIKTGESNPHNYALLYDRVAMNYQKIGIKQWFGTQFEVIDKNNQQKIKPYMGTLSDVEKRRAKWNLATLDEYKAGLERLYHSKLIIE